MCTHRFCSNIRVSILRERISIYKKIRIFLYTTYKSKIVGCYVKEKFRNYELMSGYMKDTSEMCYEREIGRILNENYMNISKDQLSEIFYFSGNTIVKNYFGSMIIVGVYKNIPMCSIKQNIKRVCSPIENFDFFDLHGDCVDDKCTKEISISSKDILNKSIVEDWINIHKIKDKL